MAKKPLEIFQDFEGGKHEVRSLSLGNVPSGVVDTSWSCRLLNRQCVVTIRASLLEELQGEQWHLDLFSQGKDTGRTSTGLMKGSRLRGRGGQQQTGSYRAQ